MATKKRYYLLITALITSASSAANAACCDYCDSSLQDTYSEWKYGNFNASDVANQDWDFDICDNWDCGTYLDCGAHCAPDDLHSTTSCMCNGVNESRLADAICNGDETCAAWLQDSSCDDGYGSGGSYGSDSGDGTSITCNDGYYYAGGSGCEECPSFTDYTGLQDFSIRTNNDKQGITSCYLPKGTYNRTPSDDKGYYQITIKEDCYYDE